jgi:2',3'-cyclic-nucleotide 2'-phosphodiesterase (5'-nucleotidase family)
MKRLFTTLLLIVIAITLNACDGQTPDPIICEPTEELIDDVCVEIEVDEDYIDFYYLNDFHGAYDKTSNQLGLAYIANLLITKKEANPDNTVILAGGDMIQGQDITDYYYGRSTVEMLNEMYFDAYVLGNHEWDWGLDKILQYKDNVFHNGEFNMPLLGANVFIKETMEHPPGIEPYTIIERNDLKIGIIGTIEYELEYAIEIAKIEDYIFTDPVEVIRENTKILRNQEDCDIVIVISHDSGFINDPVSQFTGDEKVDAIFNGHSHFAYAELTNGIPTVHSRLDGEYVGYVRINLVNNEIDSYDLALLTDQNETLLTETNNSILDLINYYKDETFGFFDTTYLNSGEDYELTDLTNWVSKNMVHNTDATIGFFYFRGSKDSIDFEELITLGTLNQFIPHNTDIQIVDLTGEQINDIIEQGNLGYYLEGQIQNDTVYQVAINQYLLERTEYPFADSQIITGSGVLIRDLLTKELNEQKSVYETFLVTNPLLTNPND